MKKCTRCKTHKPKTEFHKSKDRTDGLSYRCKDCTREYDRENWNRNSRAKALRHKRKQYNISEERYQEMISAGCAVCGTMEKLCVDHDHTCCVGPKSCGKCVRGILCVKCNAAEGMLRSDPQLAKNLADYLLS